MASPAHDGLCHHRRNLWGGHRYYSCLSTCTCRALCLCSFDRVSGFLAQPSAVCLAGRLLQLPLGLFLENSHSVWQHVSVRVKSAEVTVSLLRVCFLPWRGCPAAFGVVRPRAPVEPGLACAALLFLAVCPLPMGSRCHPLDSCQIGLGQKLWR